MTTITASYISDDADKFKDSDGSEPHEVLAGSPPTVFSITRVGAEHTSAASVDFLVTFSKPVIDVDAGDFMLDLGGEINYVSITNVSGSDSTRIVTVDTGFGNGTLSLDIPVTAIITDLAGNALENLPFTAGETYTIDKTPVVYDDTDPLWTYSPGWTAKTASNAVNGTVNINSTEGSTAIFKFQGRAFFTFYYRLGPNRGSFEIWVDGVKHKTINAYNPSVVWQAKYTSPAITGAGEHEVMIKNISPTGKYIDVDAIEILPAPLPAGTGLYDDDDLLWLYSAGWNARTGVTGPVDGTFHLTSVRGATATFVFQGSQFVFYFRKSPNRGTLTIWVDGVKIKTLDAYSAATVWQKKYTSPLYTDGKAHTIVIKNSSLDGEYIDIDAIEIK
jgi:hypothetical protein